MDEEAKETMTVYERCRRWCSDNKPTRESSGSYFRLFRGMGKVDYAYLLVGTIAAIAAGVPLPVIGVMFGKMLNQFNQASCDAGMPLSLIHI